MRNLTEFLRVRIRCAPIPSAWLRTRCDSARTPRGRDPQCVSARAAKAAACSGLASFWWRAFHSS